MVLMLSVLFRYVDLSEAIESNDSSFMDNTDYNQTDAVPLDAELPLTQYLSDEVIHPHTLCSSV